MAKVHWPTTEDKAACGLKSPGQTSENPTEVDCKVCRRIIPPTTITIWDRILDEDIVPLPPPKPKPRPKKVKVATPRRETNMSDAFTTAYANSQEQTQEQLREQLRRQALSRESDRSLSRLRETQAEIAASRERKRLFLKALIVSTVVLGVMCCAWIFLAWIFLAWSTQ